MSTYDSPARALESERLLSPACRSRSELIPRHTRAKTISGKWKYLLEYSAGPVQNVQVSCLNKNEMFENPDFRSTLLRKISLQYHYWLQMVFCENDGGNCLNENDNPHVDGSTICKQLYKTQKLLAIDEEGTRNWNSLFYWRKYITSFSKNNFWILINILYRRNQRWYIWTTIGLCLSLQRIVWLWNFR